MYTVVASLNKVIPWGKKIPATTEPGIPLCPPNHTKNRKVRDSLDTPDSRGELPAIQIQTLRPSRARVQLINTEKSECYGLMGEE